MSYAQFLGISLFIDHGNSWFKALMSAIFSFENILDIPLRPRFYKEEVKPYALITTDEFSIDAFDWLAGLFMDL